MKNYDDEMMKIANSKFYIIFYLTIKNTIMKESL